MKHLRPVFVASTFLLAACPPPPGTTTEGSSGEDSEGESTSDSSNGPTSVSTGPVDPTTGNETSATTMGHSESESHTGSSTGTTGTNSDPSTTGPPVECTDNDGCGGSTPFCEDNVCVSCSGAGDPDGACASIDGDLPVCVDGACVECSPDGDQCNGSEPVCDEATNTCVGCTEHSHCPASSCNFVTGACKDQQYVLWVDKLAVDCMAGDGTMALPFCAVNQAVNSIDNVSEWTIKIRANNYIETPVTLPDGGQVTLSGWDGSPKLRATDDSGPSLKIGPGSVVYLDHVQFNLNDSNVGVLCAGATVYADDVRLASNKLEGYQSTDCTSTIRRSVIFDNDGGGVSSYGVGETWIVNSYVSGNGTQNFGDFGGIRSAQGNELHLLYSTVLNNLSMTGPRSLQCLDDGPAEIRNSVIIAFASPSVDCVLGSFTNSVLDEGWMDGDTNLVAAMGDIANYFNPPMQGVYTAKPDTLMKDVALWLSGDPKADYNGDLRPSDDSTPDWPGADIPAM